LIEDIGNVQAAEDAPKTYSLSDAIVVAVCSYKSCRTCVVCKGEEESAQDCEMCIVQYFAADRSLQDASSCQVDVRG